MPIVPGSCVEAVAIMRVAEEDRRERNNGDDEWKDGVEEEVDGRGVRGEGVGEEGVEGSTEPVEAYGEGERQGAVARGEAADADHEADRVEPADAAPR